TSEPMPLRKAQALAQWDKLDTWAPDVDKESCHRGFRYDYDRDTTIHPVLDNGEIDWDTKIDELNGSVYKKDEHQVWVVVNAGDPRDAYPELDLIKKFVGLEGALVVECSCEDCADVDWHNIQAALLERDRIAESIVEESCQIKTWDDVLNVDPQGFDTLVIT